MGQGFIRSDPPDDSYSEAVTVAFEPDIIRQDILIEIHLRTHASTSAHKMRGKYRSAIYVHSDTQVAEVCNTLAALRPEFKLPVVTRVLPFRGFRESDQRFQRYFEKQADGPFCTRYIDPKLDHLRKNYAKFLNPA